MPIFTTPTPFSCLRAPRSARLSRVLFLTLLAATALTPVVRASAVYTEVTNFTTTGDIQTKLIAQVPTGTFTTSNSFATPFNIPAGTNYGEAVYGPVTANVNLANVTNVYTLINAYAPQPGGLIGTLSFTFSDGTIETQTLTGGVNIRDFYRGSYVNALTAPNVENVFTYSNVQGGAGTGNVTTGDSGTYVVDEQDWALSDTSTLKSVQLTTTNGNTVIGGGAGAGTPILLGITVAQQQSTSPVPEPASIALLSAGIFGLGLTRYRRIAR